MATQTIVDRATIHREERASWVPMIAIALGQMIMSFNVASLPVAHGRHGHEFWRGADHRRHGHRRVFDAGCRLRDARRQARPALRRVAGVPRARSCCSASRR